MNYQIKITENFGRVWFTSDHHFGHENIIKYCNRPFETVEEMDKALADNWNTDIRPGDTVYHLGDFCLGKEKMAHIYFGQLNGQIKVLYNPWHHDGRWQQGNLAAPLSKDGIGISALSPLVSLKIKQPQEESIYIMLCHYPLASWDRSHHGSLHLHGHCHGAMPGDQFRIDVGVDNHKFYPVSLCEILEMTSYYAKQLP